MKGREHLPSAQKREVTVLVPGKFIVCTACALWHQTGCQCSWERPGQTGPILLAARYAGAGGPGSAAARQQRWRNVCASMARPARAFQHHGHLPLKDAARDEGRAWDGCPVMFNTAMSNWQSHLQARQPLSLKPVIFLPLPSSTHPTTQDDPRKRKLQTSHLQASLVMCIVLWAGSPLALLPTVAILDVLLPVDISRKLRRSWNVLGIATFIKITHTANSSYGWTQQNICTCVRYLSSFSTLTQLIL